MTAPQLLAWIVATLLLQLAAGTLWILLRRSSDTAQAEGTTMQVGTRDMAWLGWREFRVVRREYEDPARTQCSFYLQPVDGQPLPAFKPGQFLTFSFDLPGVGSDGAESTRTITRCYSLSDRPDPAQYRVTIKRVPPPADHPEFEPGLSSNHFHDHVRVGDVLRVKAPSGHFFIDADAAVPAVLVGGGIGVTPMMSMLRWSIEQRPQRVLHFYYGVRNGREHAFKPLLEALAAAHPLLQLHVVYSRPDGPDLAGRDYQHEGHVDVELLRRTLSHGRHQFYICGPSKMMQSMVSGLRAWDVPEGDIHYEAFGPASVGRSAPPTHSASSVDTASFDVHFVRSGRTIAWDGHDANLLEFAERHGVAVDSACRAGSCGSCETGLVSGSVIYADRPDHAFAENHCLLCVARPQTALELNA